MLTIRDCVVVETSYGTEQQFSKCESQRCVDLVRLCPRITGSHTVFSVCVFSNFVGGNDHWLSARVGGAALLWLVGWLIRLIRFRSLFGRRIVFGFLSELWPAPPLLVGTTSNLQSPMCLALMGSGPSSLPCLALPCLALPCLALPCLALPPPPPPPPPPNRKRYGCSRAPVHFLVVFH